MVYSRFLGSFPMWILSTRWTFRTIYYVRVRLASSSAPWSCVEGIKTFYFCHLGEPKKCSQRRTPRSVCIVSTICKLPASCMACGFFKEPNRTNRTVFLPWTLLLSAVVIPPRSLLPRSTSTKYMPSVALISMEKEEAHINWSVGLPEWTVPINGATLRTVSPVPADFR